MTIVGACVRWSRTCQAKPSLHVNVRSLQSSCLCQFQHWIGQSAIRQQEDNYLQKCLRSKSLCTPAHACAAYMNKILRWPSSNWKENLLNFQIFSSEILADPNLQSLFLSWPRISIQETVQTNFTHCKVSILNKQNRHSSTSEQQIRQQHSNYCSNFSFVCLAVGEK